MEWSVPILLIFGLIYFIPMILAYRRRHNFELAIGLINVFLGWTVVGWVFALALASSGEDRSNMRRCVRCKDFIVSLGTICSQCRTAHSPMRF